MRRAELLSALLAGELLKMCIRDRNITGCRLAGMAWPAVPSMMTNIPCLLYTSHGLEYGSARWGTREDIAPYIDPVFQNNVILTKTESLTMNSRPKDPKTDVYKRQLK